MNTEFLRLTTNPNATTVSYGVRLRVPASVNRNPTHLILLLDISESMSDARKLENVKKCCKLILDVLNDSDHLSVITFGSHAETHLCREAVSTSQKEHIRAVINGLHVDGCTNLSAGLYAVRESLERCGADETIGLLILTDGIANMGVTSPQNLQEIVAQYRQTYPRLSVHCVGYGTDHNATLLRLVAEQNSGSYNIVNSVEDTAFAFGDTLGGLMSCVAQNVRIQIPAEATVRGPWRRIGDSVLLGDVYAGTKPTLLFTMPSDAVPEVRISGIHVDGSVYEERSTWVGLLHRDCEIELCDLRYDCSAILTDIQQWRSLTDAQKRALPDRINNLENSLRDEFFNGNTLATTLRGEIRTMREQLERAQQNRLAREEEAMLSQRSAYIGLGRGFSTPMAPRAPARGGRRLSRQTGGWGTQSLQEDPATTDEGAPFVAAQEPAQEAIFQNDVQTQLATLLRANSQGAE